MELKRYRSSSIPAPIHVELTREEDQTLQALSEADGVARRTKQRATALRLNAQGWRVAQIAKYLNCAESTVRQSLSRWQREGLVGLWDAARAGRPRRWSDSDWQALEAWLAEPRRYSAPQLSSKLASERQVQLGPEQLRRMLKKRTIAGSACVKLLP